MRIFDLNNLIFFRLIVQQPVTFDTCTQEQIVIGKFLYDYKIFDPLSTFIMGIFSVIVDGFLGFTGGSNS